MRIRFTLLAAVLLFGFHAFADSAAEKAAIDSANQWLAQVDAGKYAASWDDAAQFFKNAVSREQWAKMLQGVRAPLGKLESRKLKSATYTTSVPGAPDGQYVVIQFESSFEHKKAATETITPMLDKDGKWRSSGYFIK